MYETTQMPIQLCARTGYATVKISDNGDSRAY